MAVGPIAFLAPERVMAMCALGEKTISKEGN